MEKLTYEMDFGYWLDIMNARVNVMVLEGKIKKEQENEYKLNLAMMNVSSELLTRIGHDGRTTFKSFVEKLKLIWAAGRNGTSPTNLHPVKSLEDWISFLGICKRLIVLGYSIASLFTLLLEHISDHSIVNLLAQKFSDPSSLTLEKLDEFFRVVRFMNPTPVVAAAVEKKRSQVRCYNCDRPGHFARNCFSQCKMCSDHHRRKNCPKRMSKNDSSPSLE